MVGIQDVDIGEDEIDIRHAVSTDEKNILQNSAYVKIWVGKWELKILKTRTFQSSYNNHGPLRLISLLLIKHIFESISRRKCPVLYQNVV